jgi:hypothetical protein
VVTKDSLPSVSPEGLLLLFADQVVERSSLTSRLGSTVAYPVPGNGHLVKLGMLEQLLCAWALWGLAEGGYLQLKLAERPKGVAALRQRAVGIGGTDARVAVSVRADLGRPRTLGGELVANASEDGTTAFSLILDWVVARAPLRLDAIVGVVQAESVRRGILETGSHQQPWLRQRSFNRVLPAVKAEPKKLAELEPRFTQTKASWEHFSRSNKELHSSLLFDVSKGLTAGRPTLVGAIGAPPG